jgi:TPR repeat protein
MFCKKTLAPSKSFMRLAFCTENTFATTHHFRNVNVKPLHLLVLCFSLSAQAATDDPLAYVFKEMSAKAAKGDPDATESLAFYYENGIAVARDDAKALELHRKAAALGSTRAMESLGDYYGQKGIAHESFSWYERAEKKGSKWAMFRLGVAYQKGLGTGIDTQKARFYLDKSATGGNDTAQMYIGGLYYSGDLYPKNEKMAYAWLSVAAANNPKHSKMRDAIGEGLTPQQLQEAKDISLSLVPLKQQLD